MIGELIRYHREKSGYTVVQLANKIGVNHSTIEMWERGICNPSQLSIVKIAKALEWTNDLKHKALKANIRDGGKRLELTREFYDILHELEDEFRSVSFTPEDDPRLHQLRMMVGADTLESHGFDKKKVDKLRIKRNLSKIDLSIALGHSESWFINSFIKGSKVFTKQEAEMFAEFFEVDIKEFEE